MYKACNIRFEKTFILYLEAYIHLLCTLKTLRAYVCLCKKRYATPKIATKMLFAIMDVD